MDLNNSTIIDMLLTPKFFEKRLNTQSFKESDYYEEYKMLEQKIGNNLKQDLLSVMLSVEQYYENSWFNNLTFILNLGIKIGMEIEEMLINWDN